jgi:hypothetical protein
VGLYPITIDKRSPLVKSEEYLGTLGVGIIVGIILIIVGMLIERRRQKVDIPDCRQ